MGRNLKAFMRWSGRSLSVLGNNVSWFGRLANFMAQDRVDMSAFLAKGDLMAALAEGDVDSLTRLGRDLTRNP